MARPVKTRRVAHDPTVVYFKPHGVPLRLLREVRISLDELEALRLADLEGLSHEAAGERMGVSRATFGRIVTQARNKTAEALVHGLAIRVEGGAVEMVAGPPGRGPGFGGRGWGRGGSRWRGTAPRRAGPPFAETREEGPAGTPGPAGDEEPEE